MVSPSKQTTKAFDSRKPYRVKPVKGPKPLIYYKFFLDIEKNDANRIENKIKELGGSIDFFLNPEITHFITDRGTTKTSTLATSSNSTTVATTSTTGPPSYQQPTTPRTPFSYDSNTCQSINSPNLNDIKSTPKKPAITSRSDAMLQLARQKSIESNTKNQYYNNTNNNINTKNESPIQKAKNWGTTIWSTEYALKFFEKIVHTLRLDDLKRKQELHDEQQQYKKLNKKKIKHFKGDYIKVESFQKIYRPIYRELKNWPMINLRRRLTGSPFDKIDESQIGDTSGNRKNSNKKKLSSNLVSTNQEQQKSTTATTTRNMTRKSRTKTTTAIRVSGNNKTNSGTVVGEGGTKDIIEINTVDNTNNTKQCGYCELCHLEYDVLTVHLQSKEHVNFVKNDKNFLTLDNLINSGSANVEQFLKLNTSETSNNQNNTRKNGTINNRQNQQNSGKLSSPPASQHSKQQHKALSTPPSSPSSPQSKPPYFNNSSSSNNNNNRKRSSCGNNKNTINNYKILNNSNNCSDSVIEKNISNGGTTVANARVKVETSTTPLGSDDSPDEDNKEKDSPRAKSILSSRLKRKSSKINPSLVEIPKKTITRSAKIFADVEVTPDLLIDDSKGGPRSRRESCKRVNYAEPREEDDSTVEDKYGVHVRISDNSAANPTIKINQSIRWRAPSPHARDRPPMKSPLLYGTLIEERKDPKRNLLKPVVTLERKNYLPDSCNLTSPSSTTKTYTNREMDPKTGLVIKFQRVRQAELNLLHDEAENFMFPKKEPFSDCETDEDRQSTSEPMEMSADIVSSEAEPMIMRQYKDYPKSNSLKIKEENIECIKVKEEIGENSEDISGRTECQIKSEDGGGDDEEEMCENLDSKGSKRSRTCNRKRRNQLEAFLDDNYDYYKFENPSSRLRFQDAPVQSLSIDSSKNNENSSNVIDSTEDRTGVCPINKAVHTETDKNEEGKWKSVDLKAKEIDKYKFAFERVPNAEPWYEAFQRQDECRERIYEYFGNTAYRKLPFELGPLPPLKPNCCVLNYTPNRQKKPSVSTASTTSSSTASQLGNKKKNKLSKHNERRKHLLENDMPRISPREHASTLAILSSFIQESKKKNVNITIQSDNDEEEDEDENGDDENEINSETNQNNADDDSQQNHNIVFSPPKFGESYVNINNVKKQWDELLNNPLSLDDIDMDISMPENNALIDDSICINDDDKCNENFINIINTCPKERLTYKSVLKNEMMVKRRVYYNTKNRVLPQHLSRLTTAGKKRSINRTGWPSNKRRIVFNKKDASESTEPNGGTIESEVLCKADETLTSTDPVSNDCDKSNVEDEKVCEEDNEEEEIEEDEESQPSEQLHQVQQNHLDEMNSIASDILAVSSDSVDTVTTLKNVITIKNTYDVIGSNTTPIVSDDNETTSNSLVEETAESIVGDVREETVLEIAITTDDIGSEGYGTAASELKRELKVIIPKLTHKMVKSGVIYTNMTTRSSSKSPTKTKLSPKTKKKIAAGKKLNEKKSTMPNSNESSASSPKKYSPRKLRKPRGRWYRER